MFQTNVPQSYDDISTNDDEFKKFFIRFKALEASYPEELSILKPNQIMRMMRIQTLLNSTSEEKFLKINECLRILSQISLKEVSYLTIELNKFEGKINKRLGEEFINSLHSLNEIQSIQVLNIEKTKFDPYSFLIFMSYQPTQVGQVFIFTSKAQGRLLVLKTELDKSMVIKKLIEFKDADMYRKDTQAAEEIKQFNDSIWEISDEKQQENEETFNQLHQNKEQFDRIQLSIVFDLASTTLRQQCESVINLLKLIDKHSKQLKSIEISFQDNITKRQKQQLLSQNNQLNEQDTDLLFEESDQFLLDFNNLQLTSKLSLILRVENEIDVNLVANLAKNIQKLQIIMQDESSNDIDLQNIAAEINRIQNRTQQNTYYHKLQSLELITQSHTKNPSFLGSFILAGSLKHLTKVCLRNSSNYPINSFFEQQSTSIAAHILNSCEEINYDDQIILKNQYFLTFKPTKISFNEENEIHLAKFFMQITKPVFLAIEGLWGLSKQKICWAQKLIAKIAMNSHILSIKMDTNSKYMNEQFRQVIDEIKRYYLYLIAFEKTFSNLMICNPKQVTFDIITLDG